MPFYNAIAFPDGSEGMERSSETFRTMSVQNYEVSSVMLAGQNYGVLLIRMNRRTRLGKPTPHSPNLLNQSRTQLAYARAFDTTAKLIADGL